jgi:adenylate cyclase
VGTDFDAEGLLDGLDGAAREARLELLEQLEAEGVPLDDLHAASRDGRLLFVGAERAMGGQARYSTREVGERVGVDPEFLVALRRAQGVPVPDVDAIVCSDTDVEAAKIARAFLEAGIGEEQQLAVVRVIGRGMAQTAEALRTAALELVLEPGLSEAELTRRYADRVAGFMPMIGPMLEYMARLHLRQSVRTEAINAAERQAGALPGAREVTVCFADLVGFTRLGEQVAPDELGRVAHRLVELTAERLRGDVRLVKTIGDAAMLVGPDAQAMLGVALDLVDAADAEGEDFPQLRVGMASGAALSRAGDWYGRPVNLASRVTSIARPGSVLATRDVRDAVGDAYRWSPAGARSLKGVDGPVRLYRARRLVRDDAGVAAA